MGSDVVILLIDASALRRDGTPHPLTSAVVLVILNLSY
jgi:hypothetical protein